MPLLTPRVPSQVSNTEIATHVYNLPPHLQPQPALVMSACGFCLTSLTTQSKGEVSNGTIPGLVRAFVSGLCVRKNNYGPCEACQSAHKGSCVPIEPHFRRATNVLFYLVAYALHKTAQRFPEAESHDAANLVEADDTLMGYWRRAFEYAGQLRQALVEYPKQVKREQQKSGLSESEWAKARQVSKTHNLERYTAGLGGQGRNFPANVVVDEAAERVFLFEGSASAREKRWYYWGTDIPDASEVAAPYLSELSPKKRRFNEPSTPSRPRHSRGLGASTPSGDDVMQE